MENKISQSVLKEAKRLLMITAGACIMAVNIKSFIRAGNLVPGGFNGITLLLQQIGRAFFDVEVPYTLINLLLNAIPVFISFKFIGKKFTLYSCLMIILSSVLTDILPGYAVTQDTLLVCVFGGIINAFAISLCLKAGATQEHTNYKISQYLFILK